MTTGTGADSAVAEFVAVMRQLRAECPWKRLWAMLSDIREPVP